MKLVFSTPELIARATSAGLTVTLSPIFNDVIATVSQDVADFLEAFVFANELNELTDVNAQPIPNRPGVNDTPAALKMLIGCNGSAVFYLAKQADGWTGFTQLLSAAPLPVESVEAGLALCDPDEISGLTFELVDFPNVATLRALQN